MTKWTIYREILGKRDITAEEASRLMQAGFGPWNGKGWKKLIVDVFGKMSDDIRSKPFSLKRKKPILEAEMLQDIEAVADPEQMFIHVDKESKVVAVAQPVDIAPAIFSPTRPAWICHVVTEFGGEPWSEVGLMYTMDAVLSSVEKAL